MRNKRAIRNPGLTAISVVAVAVALALMLTWGNPAAQPAEANSSNVDFAMTVVSGGTGDCGTDADPPPTSKGAAVCAVALSSTFIVEVQLKDIGEVAGTIYPGAYEVHTVVGWTPGLTGPGDSGSGKAVSVVDCAGTPSTAAPFLAQPQTASAWCVAGGFGIFADPDALAVIGRFEFNCGSSAGQEQVSMVLASPKTDGTRIRWFYGSISDGNSSELITVECVDPVADSDLDGCTDITEVGTNANLGGQRDYNYFWDFYDVWSHPIGQPTVWVRDKVVNVPGDIFGVLMRFGPGTAQSKEDALAAALIPPVSDLGYHADFDRGPVMGPNAWDRGPPDGAINIPDDIFGVALQFGHSCA